MSESYNPEPAANDGPTFEELLKREREAFDALLDALRDELSNPAYRFSFDLEL